MIKKMQENDKDGEKRVDEGRRSRLRKTKIWIKMEKTRKTKWGKMKKVKKMR